MLYSINEFSKKVGIDRHTISDLILNGKLEFFQIGKRKYLIQKYLSKVRTKL